MDADNYSILTTQRLFTRQQGQLHTGNISGATDKQYGDFKGYADTLYTIGQITLQNGEDLNYFIEIGKASMIMIHGIRTLLRLQNEHIC